MIHENFRCEFYFIRYGQSESNATPGVIVGGNFDAPLTSLGRDFTLEPAFSGRLIALGRK